MDGGEGWRTDEGRRSAGVGEVAAYRKCISACQADVQKGPHQCWAVSCFTHLLSSVSGSVIELDGRELKLVWPWALSTKAVSV